MAAEIDRLAVIGSLRRPGDEVQLTRTIERLARADPTFAHGLLTLLVDEAPFSEKAAAFGGGCEPIEVGAERPMRIANANQRRIDLVLDGSRLRLFVEVKLNSDYQPDQLHDYLRAISAEDGEFLVAVTRDVSRFREPAPDAPGWLGVIRWPRIAKQLRDLSQAGPLRDHWQSLLDVLEEDGDLGSAEFDRDLLIAYQRSDEAYERLTDFLQHIGVGALQRLRAELTGGDGGDRSAAAFASVRRRRASTKRKGVRDDRAPDYPDVLSDGEGLYLAFNIPANGQETLWIGFQVDVKGDAVFYIAAGWGGETDPPTEWEGRWVASAKRLQQDLGGRSFTVDSDDLYCELNYGLEDFVDVSDVPSALATHLDNDLPRFVASGMFSDVPSQLR